MKRIEAKISGGYRFRLGITCLGCLAFGSWFFYDYAVGYPAKQEKQFAFQELKEAHPNDFNQRWEQVAAEKGWPLDMPGEPYPQSKIDQQLYFAIPCYAVAAWFAFGFVRAGGRWVAADEEGLATSNGVQVAWNDITGLNDDRWSTKGIAFVTYQAGGAEKHILLDDWKFDREPVKAIHKEVAARVKGDTPDADDSPADEGAAEASAEPTPTATT